MRTLSYSKLSENGQGKQNGETEKTDFKKATKIDSFEHGELISGSKSSFIRD